MSVVAMPPYPSTIPASAFSPTANDDNVWMATLAAAARRASASICVTDALPGLAATARDLRLLTEILQGAVALGNNTVVAEQSKRSKQ